jgi:hypothetical protein
MLGRLDESLRQLLIDSLPTLFAGATPLVQITTVDELFVVDPQSAEAEAGDPRVDDQIDQLPFDPAAPVGPYTLTKPPLPGPRRYRLTSALGDRVPLTDSEVIVAPDDSRVFRLQPRPDRELGGFNGLQVLYGVTAVFVRLKGKLTFKAQLQSSDPVRLEQAEALAVAAVALNRRALVERSPQSFSDADYSATVSLDSLVLDRTTAPSSSIRLLHYAGEVVVKVTRALGADEGRPIVRIRTPGEPIDPDRPIAIRIGVDA